MLCLLLSSKTIMADPISFMSMIMDIPVEFFQKFIRFGRDRLYLPSLAHIVDIRVIRTHIHQRHLEVIILEMID